jgi:starch-binding outer membrane protein, SusD/RagB family
VLPRILGQVKKMSVHSIKFYKMKNIIKVLFIAFTIIFAPSCSESYFDKVDPNNVAESNFWKTEADAFAAVMGVYSSLQNNNLYGQLYREADAITDIANYNSQANGYRLFELGQPVSNTPLVENMWSAWYTSINRANLSISRISKMDKLSDATKKRFIAECSFVRGLAYLHLTSLYGAVPLLKDEPTAENKGAVRTPVADVFKFVTDDLIANMPNLPLSVTANENGRVTRMAAETLLGKYYLTQKNWDLAAASFKKVIDSKLYSLYPDYVTLFSLAGEFSKENIFEISFADGAFGEGENFTVNLDSTRALITPYSTHVGLGNFVNSFLAADGLTTARSAVWKAATPYQNRDPRLRATVLTNEPEDLKIWRRLTTTAFACKKYNRITSQNFLAGPQNFYVFRYADVLLMYAEAINESKGATPEVYDALKLVRDRVKMPNVTAALTQTTMRDAIRLERLWELGYEGARYYDLRRWGLLETLYTKGFTGFPWVSSRAFKVGKDELWPIPQKELDNNPKLKQTDQNPGF